MAVSEEGFCQGGQGSQRAVAPDKKKKKKKKKKKCCINMDL
jgi:hypothetical protein